MLSSLSPVQKFSGTKNIFGWHSLKCLVLFQQLTDGCIYVVQIHVELGGKFGESNSTPRSLALVGTFSDQVLAGDIFLVSLLYSNKTKINLPIGADHQIDKTHLHQHADHLHTIHI